MGLLSALEDMVSFTEKLVNYNSFHINIPTGKAGEIMGIEDMSINSIGDIVGAVEEIGSKVMFGFNMASCLLNVSNWGQMLGNLSFAASAAIMDVMETVMEAISMQIKAAFQQVLGTIMNLITSIMNLIANISLLIKAFANLGDWFNISIEKFDTSRNKDMCVDLMSSIGACLLNKFLGPILDKIESQALKHVNKVGDDFNNMISEELEDTNMVATYLNREAFLLKKASIQINGLTPENVLKYGK